MEVPNDNRARLQNIICWVCKKCSSLRLKGLVSQVLILEKPAICAWCLEANERGMFINVLGAEAGFVDSAQKALNIAHDHNNFIY